MATQNEFGKWFDRKRKAEPKEPAYALVFHDSYAERWDMGKAAGRREENRFWQNQLKMFRQGIRQHPLLSKDAKLWGRITINDLIHQLSFYGFMPDVRKRTKRSFSSPSKARFQDRQHKQSHGVASPGRGDVEHPDLKDGA